MRDWLRRWLGIETLEAERAIDKLEARAAWEGAVNAIARDLIDVKRTVTAFPVPSREEPEARDSEAYDPAMGRM